MPEFFTTRIVHLDPQALSPEAVNDAATLIREGQLVAFPTETVYGLGGNALDEKAVSKIFAAKGRPATDPLIVHIESWDRLTEVALEIPRIADDLVEKFWPGPLTMVLPRQSRVAPGVSAGLPTVAVRMPAHPIALALIKAAGVPIAAPSANRFAHSSPTTAQHV
ncbi:MAG TPA: L-threonylcarbamoyladenylate synthase, partial [Aggregatilineales bacterium]|nr:L-threonylcarbamoyladenylate synthase [Aggregatilineales bacterium]